MATRRERVVLELEDQFTAGTIRAAAASELLDKRLNSLSKSSVQTSRAQADMERSIDSTGRSTSNASRGIDKYSGRLGLLVDFAATLGPSLVPISAVAIPAITTLASSLGMAALGAGAVVFAFQGVGDALQKVNKARLEPTTANLLAAHLAMQKLGPDARDLVGHLSDLNGTLKVLRDSAASGVLPGVSEAIDSLLLRIPEAEKILHRVGHGVGELLAGGADSLASSKWDDFFAFLKTEAPPAIAELGRSVGNLAHAAASLWRAFGPINASGLDWLVQATAQIDKWATGLDQTQGFQEFITYLRENGPQVGATLGAIAMALLDIVEAAAPVGSATLPILEAVAKVVSTIADSDLGTPLIALLTLTRAMSLFGRAIDSGPGKSIRALGPDIKTMADTSVVAFGRATDETERYNKAAARTRETLGKLGKGAGIVGGLALAQSGLADKIGLSNTAMYASLGLMAGPWGAAVGGGIGLIADFATGQKDASVSAGDLVDTLDKQTGAITDNTRAAVANSLQKQGVFDDAVKLGLSLADVTAAALGDADAIARVNAVLDLYGSAVQSVGTGRGASVSGWNAEAAAATSVRDAIGGQNKEVADAVSAGGQLVEALLTGSSATRDSTRATQDAKGPLADLTVVTDVNKDGVIDQTDAILANIDARNSQTDAVVSAFDAETAYQRALQVGADREKAAADLRKQIADAEASGAQDRTGLRARLAAAKTPAERATIRGEISDSLKRQADTVAHLNEQLAEYAPTLDKTTKAGQANRDVLSQMASAWNTLTGKQQDAKGKYEEIRQALIKQAEKFGATKKRAKEYADQLLDVPPRIETKILLEQQKAQDLLDAYSTMFNGMDGKVAQTFLELKISRVDQMAESGQRTGKPHARGGLVSGPGSGTSDSILTPTSNGEYVTRADVVKRLGVGFFDSLNASPAPPRQRLTSADLSRGGHAVMAAGAGIDYDRLASAMLNARPLYGPVTVHGDGDFERQARMDARLASKGGH